jgi:4-amino-4-deoxy-L-arabinose transferase-like glycosyltransferase
MIKKILPLVLIILLAVFLRTYRLDNVPPALFGDEVDVGYQAYSLAKTGKDITGRFMPTYIRSIAEYRAPLFIYSAVPFISFFGLNEWGVRLPAAFWGILSILGLYLLVNHLFGRKVALLSALLLTLSPWHLQYSRASFEVTLLLFLLIYGCFFFVSFEKRRVNLLFSMLLFGLTPYTYSTASVFTPLLILILGVTYLPKLRKDLTMSALAGLVLLITVFPAIISIYKGEARERFQTVSIFQESVLLDKANLARVGLEHNDINGEKQTVNSNIEVLFHNKPAIFTQVFSLNYLRAFSFEFLFGKGDPNYRHSIQEMGELYLFELPLLLLGFYVLFTKVKLTNKIIVLGWLIIAPIPASLTFDGGFHSTRLILMLPPLIILNALGVSYLSERIKRLPFLIVSSLLLILAIIGVTFYIHRYYIHYPIESWRWWQIGYKER